MRTWIVTLTAALAVVACLAVTACGSSSPTAPTTAVVNGTWSGPANDNFGGSGTVTLTLAQNGATLTGTWSAAYPNSANDGAGTLTGTVNGSAVAISLAPSRGTACPNNPSSVDTTLTNITATVSGTTLNGTYNHFLCVFAISGTLTLTKN